MSGQRLGSNAIIGDFYLRLEQALATSWAPAVAMAVNSDQESEEYAWLGMAPKMREWVGGRQAKGLRDNGITIRNKTFESTLDIPIDWIRRDKTGQILVRVNDLADRVAAHPMSLLSTLMINGEATDCYDGQYFFDTDHAEGDSGSQSNDITVDISAVPVSNHGSITAPSVGEMAAAIQSGIQQILGFKDDTGEPMNELAREFLIMVPSTMLNVALAATSSAFIDSGDTNSLAAQQFFRTRVIPNVRLNSSWTDRFAIFRTDGSAKPFIHQVEQNVMMDVIGEGSEHAFKHNAYQYGVKTIENVGYGFWQMATLVTLV